MEPPESSLIPALMTALAQRGLATSGQLQALLGRSQPSVSRLLTLAAPQLLVLGAGRSTRYALPQTILGQAAQQDLWWVQENGHPVRWGRLSWISGQGLHVQAEGIDHLERDRLPQLPRGQLSRWRTGQVPGKQRGGPPNAGEVLAATRHTVR